MLTGTVIGGRYRIERVLGQGGMGFVVAATHLHLEQQVAIKMLLPEVLSNAELARRFLREAQAAVRLRSEHVARVLDVGTAENHAPYMVLEYLEGKDLSSGSHGRMSSGVVVDLILQACEALHEAHSLGFVHRDIKPANLFVTRRSDGTPLLKVLDFGISKLPTQGVQLTATQAIMGTPAYMSPEQMRSSKDVDHRSDIWSLGVVLYELLEGSPPFVGETFSALVVQVVTEPLRPIRAALPRGLEQIIYRCLEKDPARRFRDVAELVQSLAKYASSQTQAAVSAQRTSAGQSLAAGRQSRQSQPAAPTTLSLAIAPRPQTSAQRPRWAIFASIAVACLAGIAVAASFISARRTSEHDLSISHTSDVAVMPSPSIVEEVRDSKRNAEVAAIAAASLPNSTQKADISSPDLETAEMHSLINRNIREILAAFIAWSRRNPNAACPHIDDLGHFARDPWNHDYWITCVMQPDDQIVGIASSGPDGIPATEDDVMSWMLHQNEISSIRGRKWSATPRNNKSEKREGGGSSSSNTQNRKSITTQESQNPVKPQRVKLIKVDEDGLPISR